MSSHRIQSKMEGPSPDAIDEMIRWALLGEVAGEEPSPQVWRRIQAWLATSPRFSPSRSEVDRPWRQFTSVLHSWVWGIVAPMGAERDSWIAPREHSHLIWRETLPLWVIPTVAMIIY